MMATHRRRCGIATEGPIGRVTLGTATRLKVDMAKKPDSTAAAKPKPVVIVLDEAEPDTLRTIGGSPSDRFNNTLIVAADMPTATPFMLHIYAAMAEAEGIAISTRTKAPWPLPRLAA
jgi:hypothetical protein